MPQQSQSSAAGADRAKSRFASAYRVLEEAIKARAFPGCAFGVFAGGETVIQDALGRFTFESESPTVAAETRFDVASLTKVVGATAAAMLLVDRQQLDLETPLGEILPAFLSGRAPGDLARFVTLRHLLAHNSGLPGYVELFRNAATPEELMRACLALPIEAAPGTRAEYSDPGFILLGKALEVRILEPLDTWLTREVFDPLNMCFDRLLPCRAPAQLNSPHRAGHMVSPSSDSGRSAGRKRFGARWRSRACRALLQCSRSSAIRKSHSALPVPSSDTPQCGALESIY